MPSSRSDRDILQVRVAAGQSAGGGHRLIEGGVDSAGQRVDLLLQFVDIGGFQFGQHPVRHDGGRQFMISGQFFQHSGVGGIAGFGLATMGQLQFFEKDLPELPR